jgi:hypothetical protein
VTQELNETDIFGSTKKQYAALSGAIYTLVSAGRRSEWIARESGTARSLFADRHKSDILVIGHQHSLANIVASFHRKSEFEFEDGQYGYNPALKFLEGYTYGGTVAEVAN